MTVDQVIAFSASIAGCLSALAAFWAVREMVKQRQESYRPDPALSGTYFVGIPDPVLSSPLPMWWIAGVRVDLSKLNNRFFTVPLRNVGLGTAKHITVTWSLEVEDLAREVNRLAEKVGTEACVAYKDGEVWCKSGVLKGYVSVWKNQRVRKIDYLLPASVETEAFQLEIPLTYILFSTLLIHLGSREKDMGSVAVPTLGVTFDYSDIGGVRHQALYDIKCSVMMTSEKQIQCYLESERRA
jgi:hypothetical protein